MSFLADPADPEKSIFSILDPRVHLESDTFTFECGRGTAVAISEDLLVTCQHVVTDAREVALFSHHPISEGETVLEKKRVKGKVIRTDEKLEAAGVKTLYIEPGNSGRTGMWRASMENSGMSC